MKKEFAEANRAAARERDRLKSLEIVSHLKPKMRVYDPVLGAGTVIRVHRMMAVVEFKTKYGGARQVNRPGHCLSLKEPK